MSTEEQQTAERADAGLVLECIVLGFVLGVAYCTTIDLLRLKNEVRIIHRINRFRQAWHDSRLDEKPAEHPAEEKPDDGS